MTGGRCRGTRQVAATVLVGASLLVATACSGSGTPGNTAGSSAAPPPSSAAPTPDPSVKQYCDTVSRVQAEQTAPGAGQGGLAANADAYRRQVDDLAAASPPEIAGEWQTVRSLTDQALGSLAATGGDPSKIDPGALIALQRQAQPSVDRIVQVTQQRCGITFSLPG